MLRWASIIIAVIACVAGLAACSVLGIVDSLTPTDTYIATENLVYGPEPREMLDIYQPRPADAAPPPRDGYPVVVFFYGGTWRSGERREYRFIGEALAARGI
ncbi:MAG: alpha/beta hydrolase, partial [Betaproteobacteria bacterium]|nr:alpha/beta hydrolase [Betaproteobacteria bacterium]